MSTNTRRRAGRHFLQIPGPSPVPERIMRAMDMPVIDHRGPEFQKLGKRVLEKVKGVFKTKGHVFIYPSSGTGGWEAALANLFAPGDLVLMYETGHFATLWKNMAQRLGVKVEFIASDWRGAIDPSIIEARLRADAARAIKAVCVVHNETSTGVSSPIDEVRKAIDAAGHPALLLVDTVSGVGSIDYRHDEWGVDVTVGGSQKGLMLPPGVSLNAVSEKALRASQDNGMPRLYWSWQEMAAANANGFFPYTPATNLLYGLDTALDMLSEEGLDHVFARHKRHAEATRRAVGVWGLEIVCRDARFHSPVLTAVLLPDGHDADNLRRVILENFDMSLGMGLGRLAGKAFRIGHLGDINDLTLLAAISGVEMGLAIAGVPHHKGGVLAAMDFLRETAGQ